MLKKIFIWPILITLIYLLLLLQRIFTKCNSGMFIGGCEIASIFFFTYLINALILYAIFILLNWLLSKKIYSLKLDIKLSIIYGLLTFLLTFFLNIFGVNFFNEIYDIIANLVMKFA